MICVGDLCALASISGIEVLSGAGATSRRPVREVAIMDDEPLTGSYDVFHPGDAVFASLSFCGGDSAVMDEAVAALASRDVACVLVKGSLPYAPSEAVLAECRRRAVPLIRYGAGLLEQIISEARALIAEDARADRVEEALRALMERRRGDDVRQRFGEVTGLGGSWVQVAAFSAAEGDPLVLAALKNQVACELSRIAPCFTARFGDGVVACVSWEGPEEGLSRASLEALVAGFGSHTATGASEVLPADEADVALHEAFGCLEAAREDVGDPVLWQTAGFDAFHAARRRDPLLARACEAGLDLLRASDEETGGNLVESMGVYVTCGGDVTAAAVLLAQHPNSMRNRINRARKVLSLENATDKELFAYLAMIYL